MDSMTVGGFPEIRGTVLGVPIIRTIAFGGLYWGPPLFQETTCCVGSMHAKPSRLQALAAKLLWMEDILHRII